MKASTSGQPEGRAGALPFEAATRQLSCRTVASQDAMDAIAETATRDRYCKDMRSHKR